MQLAPDAFDPATVAVVNSVNPFRIEGQKTAAFVLLEQREWKAPDWKAVVWNEAERKKGQAWGLKTIESFHSHGTPPAPHKQAAE